MSDAKCKHCDQVMGHATNNPSDKSAPRVCWNTECYEERMRAARGTPAHETIHHEWRTNCEYLHLQRDQRRRAHNEGRSIDHKTDYTWLGGPTGSQLEGRAYGYGGGQQMWGYPPGPGAQPVMLRPVDPRELAKSSSCMSGTTLRSEDKPTRSENRRDRKRKLHVKVDRWRGELPSNYGPSSMGKQSTGVRSL